MYTYLIYGFNIISCLEFTNAKLLYINCKNFVYIYFFVILLKFICFSNAHWLKIIIYICKFVKICYIFIDIVCILV